MVEAKAKAAKSEGGGGGGGIIIHVFHTFMTKQGKSKAKQSKAR